VRHKFGVFTSCEAGVYDVSLRISVGDRQQFWVVEVCRDDDDRVGDKSVGKYSVALLCVWVTRSNNNNINFLCFADRASQHNFSN